MLAKTHEMYGPVAARCTTLYFAIGALKQLAPAYAWNLGWFLHAMDQALEAVGPRKKDETEHSRVSALNRTIFDRLWTSCSPGLLIRHRLLCATSIAARLLLADKRMQPGEWAFLLAQPIPYDEGAPLPARPNGAPWLDARAWSEVCALSALNVRTGKGKWQQPRLFGGLQPIGASQAAASASTAVEDGTRPAASGKANGAAPTKASPQQPPDAPSASSASLDFPFAGLAEHIAHKSADWSQVACAEEGHTLQLPGEWQTKLSFVQRMCVLKALRRDKLLELLRGLVIFELGSTHADAAQPTLASALKAARGHEPIAILTAGRVEPVRELQLLCDRERGPGQLRVVSLGVERGAHAERAMRVGAEAGEWVLLHDCHLAKAWLPRLAAIAGEQSAQLESELRVRAAEALAAEKEQRALVKAATDADRAAQLRAGGTPEVNTSARANRRALAMPDVGKDAERHARPNQLAASSKSLGAVSAAAAAGGYEAWSAAGAVKVTYRLWLTAPIEEPLPPSLLERSFKLAYEPPASVRASLRTSFAALSPAWVRARASEPHRLRAVYAVSLFHALTLRRAAFGSIGYVAHHGFDEADLEVALRQLDRLFASSSMPSVRALQQLLAETTYGGRVHSAWDRRALLVAFDTAVAAPLAESESGQATVFPDGSVPAEGAGVTAAAAVLEMRTALMQGAAPMAVMRARAVSASGARPARPLSAPQPALAKLLPPPGIASFGLMREFIETLPAFDTAAMFGLHASAAAIRAEESGRAVLTELSVLEPHRLIDVRGRLRSPVVVGFQAGGKVEAGLNARPRDVLVRSIEAAQADADALRRLSTDLLGDGWLAPLDSRALEATVAADGVKAVVGNLYSDVLLQARARACPQRACSCDCAVGASFARVCCQNPASSLHVALPRAGG